MFFRYNYLILIIISCILCSNTFAAETLHIEMTGIKDDLLKNVESRLAADHDAYEINPTQAAAQHFYRTAPDTIRKALEPYGYFKSQIHPALHLKNGTWIAHFYIHLGPPLYIHRVDLQVIGPGKEDPLIKEYIQKFPLTSGQIFQTPLYEKAKTDLFQVVNNQGYLKATLEKKSIQINLKNNTAYIELTINTGHRYYFGTVHFNKTPYSPKFLQRFVTFHPGEPFSSQTLLTFQQDLNASYYFKQVVATPEFPQEQDYKIPTTVEVTLPKSQQYKIGLGYGTYTGPRLTTGVDLRRIGDSGQHFTAEMKLSSVISGLAAKYFIPGKNPLTDQYTVGANLQNFHPKNGHSFSEAISAGWLKSYKTLHYSFILNMLNEHYDIEDKPRRNSHLLYPAFNISNVTADDIVNPSYGSSVNFVLRGSSEQIFSTTSFIQSEIKGKYIISPTTLSRLIFRGDLGYTVVKDLNQLPLSLNFFAGGLSTVRGYNLDSIGPGRYLKVASAELQHRIIGNWNGAVFYDVGTAANHFSAPLNRGDGIGLIYTSLIGPIKLYLGRAESKKDKPITVEFSIGADLS